MQRIRTRWLVLAAAVLPLLWGGIYEWNRGQTIKWNREAAIHNQFWGMVAGSGSFTDDDMGILAAKFRRVVLLQSPEQYDYLYLVNDTIRFCQDDSTTYPGLPSSLRNELFWGMMNSGTLNSTGMKQLDAFKHNPANKRWIRGQKAVPPPLLSMIQGYAWSPFMLGIVAIALFRALWVSMSRRTKKTRSTMQPRNATELLAEASQCHHPEIQSRVEKLRELVNAQGSAKQAAEEEERIADLKGELDLAISLAEHLKDAEKVVYFVQKK